MPQASYNQHSTFDYMRGGRPEHERTVVVTKRLHFVVICRVSVGQHKLSEAGEARRFEPALQCMLHRQDQRLEPAHVGQTCSKLRSKGRPVTVVQGVCLACSTA